MKAILLVDHGSRKIPTMMQLVFAPAAILAATLIGCATASNGASTSARRIGSETHYSITK